MDSNQQQPQTTTAGASGAKLPPMAIAAIVIACLIVVGAIGYYIFKKRGASSNLGTPNVGAAAAVPTMPTAANVGGGTSTNVGGIARNGVNVTR